MQKQRWYHIIPRNTGLSIYAWIIFCILPFYFVFKNSSPTGIIFGLVMILLFFAVYRLSFLSKGWTVYISVGIEMTISMIMTMFLGYVYFSLFLAFYIGNIERKASFVTLYVIHLLSTLGAVGIGFFTQTDIFLSQLPFIVISVLGVILLPFTLYNLNKQERLESQLKDANKKISQLMVLEERQRIARDLHDTLGQKLSLIGLKSDLAGKIIDADRDTAKSEIDDIHQTARIALKEVREMVSDMKEARLDDEILRVRQILQAAQMACHIDGEPKLKDTPLLIESVLTMCLKEAVTNVVKHSQATSCHITIKQLPKEWLLKVKDNGIGLVKNSNKLKENGIQGMRERLEFVNGNLDIQASKGMQVTIRIPNVIKEVEGQAYI